MPANHLFEYAVIRVVPRVEREEFINVGVILYCKQERFLQIKYTLSPERVCSFAAGLDMQEVEDNLQALAHICAGEKNGGPIAGLDAASRFRWITATRSTVVQPSKVHPGLCVDAAETLERLFAELVG
ncbi:DUF3037 domain-containing protein [soil metagenome]|jgi:hypothetical protein